MSAKPCTDLTNIKQGSHPTADQIKRRAQIARLKASLVVPQYTSIATKQASKQQPASSRFATI